MIKFINYYNCYIIRCAKQIRNTLCNTIRRSRFRPAARSNNDLMNLFTSPLKCYTENGYQSQVRYYTVARIYTCVKRMLNWRLIEFHRTYFHGEIELRLFNFQKPFA